MSKIVDGSEFMMTKRSVSATKVADGDKVVYIRAIKNELADQTIILETVQGYFLRFALASIPEKKRGAIGVRGMKLQEQDEIHHVYLPVEEGCTSIDYKGKPLEFNRLKMAVRDGKGTKVRR
jgi:DNA gyrase subunit A